MDFGAGSWLVSAAGKRTKTWICRVVLSHSRKGYTEAVLRQTTEAFLRCLENAFRHFGGVIVFDPSVFAQVAKELVRRSTTW